MYTLADVYKTFPSGCTEDYKILRAFEMGKQTSDKEIESLSKHILDLQKDKGNLTDRVRELEDRLCNVANYLLDSWCRNKDDYCPHLAKLEKENAELEYQLTHRNCLDCSNHSSNLRMRNLALEKENAELKKQLGMSNKVYNDNLDYSHHIEEQLTNAKEIIRKFMKYEINEYDGSLEIHFEELKKQAERFLNNEVEK